MITFIDVSKWNGVFDWSKAQAQGVEGAWLKVCQDTVVDSKFKENSASCTLKYHAGYPYFDYRGKSGADQCKFFLDTVGSFSNMRDMLDLEDNSANGWPKLNSMLGVALREALAWVNEYILEVKCEPAIYLNTGLTILKQLTVSGYQYTFRNFTKCPLVVANYNKYILVNGAWVEMIKPPTGAWDECAGWQHTSTGDGQLFGNAPGNIYIDIDKIFNLQALLKPGVTPEDEIPVPVELSDAEKLKILWAAHPELHK